jgi:hypothetical protein
VIGREAPSTLPADGAFLGRVHLVCVATAQKDGLDLLIEKGLGSWISRVKAIVVDQEGLVLKPLRPASLADLPLDAFPEGVLERRSLRGSGVLLTALTANRIQWKRPIEVAGDLEGANMEPGSERWTCVPGSRPTDPSEERAVSGTLL